MSRVLGYVYTIQIKGTNLYKIGLTRRLEYRILELKRKTKYDLLLIDVIATNDPERLEKELYKKYDAYRAPQSEWFAIKDFVFFAKKKGLCYVDSLIYQDDGKMIEDLFPESFISTEPIIEEMQKYADKVLDKYGIIDDNENDYFTTEKQIMNETFQNGIRR